ncbi:hypothetical protein M3Y97_00365400 [Aphelenchoides bicaudatus]|nr:hypothetical protein M3Y97_00365400 [Aphelenchoides bicaudatus]
MARHRHIKNINIDEELDDEDFDRDYYGKSVEDEPLTPSTSRFMYQRNANNSMNQGHNLTGERIGEVNEDEYHEEGDETYSDDGDFFEMDDIAFKPKSGANKQQQNKSAPAPQKPKDQPTQKKATFVIGSEHKSPKTTKPIPPTAIEHLKISELKPSRAASKSPSRMTPNTSFHQLSAIEVALNSSPTHKIRKRQTDAKNRINLIIAGHVDAGKSTLVGHILYLFGHVDEKTMSKYKQQSNRLGKGSFAFAWILDDTEEERNRGVTMDLAHASFETKMRHFNILDAPGHRDFIANMINGAAQADAALLVINATKGEFESGYDQGGQTREHALLLRSMGVQRMLVAINKMDTVDWSKERFDEIQETIGTFLKKQAGFIVRFVPVSGLDGVNLVRNPDASHPLMQWYSGPSLVDLLDTLDAPPRAEDKSLRIIINDVHKCTSNLLTLSGLIATGSVETGDKVFVMPRADSATVKALASADNGSQQVHASSGGVYFAGDQIIVTLSGVFEPDSVYPGGVICQGGSDLLVPAKSFVVKLILFDDALPILKGTRAELFSHAVRIPCIISKLRSINNKQTGEATKANPRVITKSMSATVEITADHAVCIETYEKCKFLGRLTLRINGRTVAAGLVEEVLK